MALNKQLERTKDDQLKGSLRELIDQTQKELDAMKREAKK
jgi:hypothetical protein